MHQSISGLELGDVDPGLFELLDERTLQWALQYLSRRSQDAAYPLSPGIKPGEVADLFPAEPPASPQSPGEILNLFETNIVPHTMGWNTDGFMGYFGLGSSLVAVIAQKLEAVLTQTRMQWSTSPAATELEKVVLGWIKRLLGLPDTWFGMLHTNSRVDLALVAALEAQGYDISSKGFAGLPQFCCYASTEAHGANEKAMAMVGLGKNNLRRIAVDDRYCMDSNALRQAIEKDIQLGYMPLMVIATIGTTSTTSIDPIPAIADICEEYGLWLHVDAAYAGLFAIDPEMRWILSGCERAESFTTNPHKLLYTPFDHSIFFIKRPELLKQALRSNAAYLVHSGTPGATDLYDFTDKIPHRFPALTLWMVLCFFGVDGIISRQRRMRELAQVVMQRVRAHPEMEVMAPAPFTVVCFRAHPQGMRGRQLNALNKRLMDEINTRGRYFISDTILQGRFTLRIAIGNIKTDQEPVDGLWQEVITVLEELKRDFMPTAGSLPLEGIEIRAS